MKRFTTTLLATAALFGASMIAMPAAAACSFWTPCSDSSSFNYGVGGEVSNSGEAYGSLSGANSGSVKNVYGGGDSMSATGQSSTANAYSGADFGTSGNSYGGSLKFNGTASAGSQEHGMVVGDGMAGTTESWGNITATDQATYAFGAGGDAVNTGSGTGGVAWAGSATTKNVYGGGNAVSNTGSNNDSASAYSGSHMATTGFSGAASFGGGTQGAGSTEYGTVGGGGATSAGTTRTYGLTN